VSASDDSCRWARLKRSKDFARLFSGSLRCADRFFTVLGKKNDSSVPRLGLAVSKRVASKAVARNRLKRLAREAFRCQNGLPDWDFVVIARPAAAAEGNNMLKRSLEKHFQRLTRKANEERNGQS